MSNQIKYNSLLNRRRKISYRKDLKREGKIICNGSLCKGLVKPIEEFTYLLHRNRCDTCELYMLKKKYKKNKIKYLTEKNKLKENKHCNLCGIKNVELLEYYKIICNQKELKFILELPKTIIMCKWCLMLIEKQIFNNLNKKNIYYSLDDEIEKINFKKSKSCNGQLCKGRLRNLDKFKGNIKWCKKCHNYNKIIKKYIIKVF